MGSCETGKTSCMRKRFFLLHVVFFLCFSNLVSAQNIYLLNGNDTLRQNTNDLTINLMLIDTVISLKAGYNNLKQFNPDNCKAIQIIHQSDTLYFNEKKSFDPNTPQVLINVLNTNAPDFKKILSKSWTVILDKVPVQNKELRKAVQGNIKKGTKIIGIKTDQLYWVVFDKDYTL